MRKLVIVFVIALSLASFTSAQTSRITAQQSIYIAATKTNEKGMDLDSENKAKEEFSKQKKFNLAPAAANADIIFLLLVEYDSYSATVGTVNQTAGSLTGVSATYRKSILAMAVPASTWREHKTDIEKLREHALWQGNTSYSRFKEASVSKIVKQFHDEILKKNRPTKK